jgi:hypothetical protein
MFRSIGGFAIIALVAAAWLCLSVGPPPAQAASADKLTLASPLLILKMIDVKQAKLLQRAGVGTIRALAHANPSIVARALKIDKTRATGLVKEAKVQLNRFQQVYYAAQKKYQILVQLGAVAGSGEDRYASLIEPTNECTILVRKVCGLENQCATGPDCPVAMQMLERYNEESDPAATAESCVIALEDAIVFNQCID